MSDETSRLARLEATLTHIKEQVDHMVSLTQALTQVQTEQVHFGASLGRSVERLDLLEDRLGVLEGSQQRHTSALQDEIGGVRTQLRVYGALFTGGFLGGGAVWAVVAYVIKTDVVSVLKGMATAAGG